MKTIDLAASSPTKTTHNNRIPIPSAIGKGGIEMFFVKPGIHLSVADYRLDEPVRFRYIPQPDTQDVLGIGFCLSGHSESHPACLKKPFPVKAGQSVFFSFPGMIEFMETIKSRRMLSLTVIIEPAFLDSLAADYPEFISEKLPGLGEGPCHCSDEVTPAMQSVINQILSCSFRGVIRRLFIEGKVMELLAYKMDQCRTGSPHLGTASLKPDDIGRVRQAARLMACDPEHVKNLSSLARSVGMCRTKLHRCFGLVYGISPFEYLHRQRLETAMSLLQQGRMNVTEVAYAVGYSSLSHFAKTFKHHVGVSPNKYLKSPFPNQINDCVIEKDKIVSLT